jgi:hypothetical protein
MIWTVVTVVEEVEGVVVLGTTSSSFGFLETAAVFGVS